MWCLREICKQCYEFMCAYSAISRLKIINNKSIEAIELSKIPRDIWARGALSEIIPRKDFGCFARLPCARAVFLAIVDGRKWPRLVQETIQKPAWWCAMRSCVWYRLGRRSNTKRMLPYPYWNHQQCCWFLYVETCNFGETNPQYRVPEIACQVTHVLMT